MPAARTWWKGSRAALRAKAGSPSSGDLITTAEGELYVADGTATFAGIERLPHSTEVGVPTFWDNFTNAADGPLNGRVALSGHVWSGGGGQVLPYIVSGTVQKNPADTAYTSYYATIDLGFAPTWFRMVGDFTFSGGNDSSLNGGCTMISANGPTPWVNNAPGLLLHNVFGYNNFNLSTSDGYPLDTLHPSLAATNMRFAMATLTSGSTSVTAFPGSTFEPTEQPVGVTGTGIVGAAPWLADGAHTLLTYVDDTHATLSNAATQSGTVLLAIIRPMRTDESVTYHAEIIANAETNELTVEVDGVFRTTQTVKKRKASLTLTSGSPVVGDPNVLPGHIGMVVTGPGIPAGSYVGTVTYDSVTPANSTFRLTSSRSSQVDVNATTTGVVSADIGQNLANFMNRYFIWEGQQNSNPAAPVVRWKRMAIYTRNDAAQPGLSVRALKGATTDLYARRYETWQVRSGKVPTAVGTVPGFTLGPNEDADLYRLGPSKLATDGFMQAKSLGVQIVQANTSRTMDPVTDGVLICNGANVTHTLPVAATAPVGRMYWFKNINATPLTIVTSTNATTGLQDKLDGTWTTLTLQRFESVLIVGNGNNSWWPLEGFHLGMVLNGVPTAVAGTNAGTGAPAPVVLAGSTDLRFQIGFGTGTSPALGEYVVVTFSSPLPRAPFALDLQWAGTNSTSALTYLDPSSTGTNKLTTTGVGIRVQTALAASQVTNSYRLVGRVVF